MKCIVSFPQLNGRVDVVFYFCCSTLYHYCVLVFSSLGQSQRQQTRTTMAELSVSNRYFWCIVLMACYAGEEKNFVVDFYDFFLEQYKICSMSKHKNPSVLNRTLTGDSSLNLVHEIHINLVTTFLFSAWIAQAKTNLALNKPAYLYAPRIDPTYPGSAGLAVGKHAENICGSGMVRSWYWFMWCLQLRFPL